MELYHVDSGIILVELAGAFIIEVYIPGVL